MSIYKYFKYYIYSTYLQLPMNGKEIFYLMHTLGFTEKKILI